MIEEEEENLEREGGPQKLQLNFFIFIFLLIFVFADW
jgi:hypothetical protein